MHFFKLILRNRAAPQAAHGADGAGLVVAFLSFGLLQTIVDAWYHGAEGAAPNRLITRNAVSLVVPLPLALPRKDPRGVTGVKTVAGGELVRRRLPGSEEFLSAVRGRAGAVFRDVSGVPHSPRTRFRAFLRDRKGAIVGRKLAETYGWKVGDAVPLKGTIFPGQLGIRRCARIYDAGEAKTDTSQFFFHWEYLNETMRQRVAAAREPGRHLRRRSARTSIARPR